MIFEAVEFCTAGILSVDWQYTVVRLFVVHLTTKYLQRYLFGFRSPRMSSYSFWYIFCSKIVRSSADSDLPFWNQQTASLCLWHFRKCEFPHFLNSLSPSLSIFSQKLVFHFQIFCVFISKDNLGNSTKKEHYEILIHR